MNETRHSQMDSLPLHIHDEKNGLDYILHGDYYLPDMDVETVDLRKFGKWGRLRYSYLLKHQPKVFWEFVRKNKLNAHLKSIDQQANDRIEVMMEKMKQKHGITEALKAGDQMVWAGAVNNVRHCIEEVILKDLIFT